MMVVQDMKPTTHQSNLAKLPQPLAPLIARPQWAVWRWTRQANGKWQKPPFMALEPDRHASTSDPSTWCDYATALATVQAGKADGITYILAKTDPFIAMDLDHCRDPNTGSIDIWAQNFLDTTRNSYAEVTPSGDGIRIWGLTTDTTAAVNRKFTLEIDSKLISVELFRHTHKALTITGYRLDTVKALASIDKGLDWAIVWGERRKAAAAEAKAATQTNGHEFNALGGRGHDIEYIDKMVREGAPNGGNRSDNFHVVVGHYLGCDWGIEQIYQHIQQFPDGIGSKYIGEGRLRGEIERSARKFEERQLPLSGGWTGPATEVQTPPLEPEDDAELRMILPRTILKASRRPSPRQSRHQMTTTRPIRPKMISIPMTTSTTISTTIRQVRSCRRCMRTATPISGRWWRGCSRTWCRRLGTACCWGSGGQARPSRCLT
jgi:hypothetical protein